MRVTTNDDVGRAQSLIDHIAHCILQQIRCVAQLQASTLQTFRGHSHHMQRVVEIESNLHA